MAKDRKKEGKKAEKSVHPLVPAQDTTVEETQANPVDKELEEVQEPPDQDVPLYKEPSLSLVIVQR